MTGERPLKTLTDLSYHTLLHDSSRRDWQAYIRQADLQQQVNVQHGPIFSHSAMVIQAAVHGQGVALVNNVMAKMNWMPVARCARLKIFWSVRMRFIWCVRTVRLIPVKSQHSVSGLWRRRRVNRKN